MKVSTVSEMRSLDKAAIEKYGIAEEILMENAGLAAFSVILNELEVEENSFVVICGAGNNGGDGFVVARKIHSMGGKVSVVLLGDPTKYRGAALKNYEIALRLKIPVEKFETIEQLKAKLADCDTIVDAIFGTGLVRNVEGVYEQVIAAINQSHKMVFALDIPSGINGDTGAVMGIAVRADSTISFGLPKLGNLLYPGYEYCGLLYVTHISFPHELWDNESLLTEINLPERLPLRDVAGHKTTFGDALFIAGAANYYGAPYFAAMSFLKAGGGYSRLAAPRSVTSVIGAKGSELVFAPQDETTDGSLAASNKERLLTLSQQVDMVVIGPGMSLNQETQQLICELVQQIEKPILIDGDGITAVAQNPEIISHRKFATILTPHPGELSRLCKTSIAQIEADRVQALQKALTDLSAFIILKGAHSLIGCPGGRVCINLSGNSGMATAGSGDVLTGTIAAMLGLGLTVKEAVKAGVFIHGLAGDLAADIIGEDGMTAQHILNYLPLAVKRYREDYENIMANCYGTIIQV
ncbi:MAG TPA: NAD(P)H-hydrate dehydratase [bacterium]|nr:NAD(P)H-hydrate dehydratase [bacterium]